MGAKYPLKEPKNSCNYNIKIVIIMQTFDGDDSNDMIASSTNNGSENPEIFINVAFIVMTYLQ